MRLRFNVRDNDIDGGIKCYHDENGESPSDILMIFPILHDDRSTYPECYDGKE